MSGQLNIICVSGTQERLQMAAMTAAVAGAGGTAVIVFLSMNTLPYFVQGSDQAPPAEGFLGEAMTEKGAPSFRELFENARELGEARLYACSMALDVMGLSEADLNPILEGTLGLTGFLDEASDGQIVVF